MSDIVRDLCRMSCWMDRIASKWWAKPFRPWINRHSARLAGLAREYLKMERTLDEIVADEQERISIQDKALAQEIDSIVERWKAQRSG